MNSKRESEKEKEREREEKKRTKSTGKEQKIQKTQYGTIPGRQYSPRQCVNRLRNFLVKKVYIYCVF